MTTVTLSLPMPPSVNQLYANARGKGRIKTAKYRDWLTEAGVTLEQQKPDHLSGWVSVTYLICKPDARKRDLMNLEKALSDLLCKHYVIEDDSYITVAKLAWVRPEDVLWKDVLVQVTEVEAYEQEI